MYKSTTKYIEGRTGAAAMLQTENALQKLGSLDAPCGAQPRVGFYLESQLRRLHCRTALCRRCHLRHPNTGIIRVRNVRKLLWDGAP